MRFKDKTAVVTGGGGGFGSAFGAALAAEGARVLLADVDGALASAAAAEICANGGEAMGLACDVTDEASVQALMDAALSKWGSLDILINNAGGSMGVPQAPVDEVETADWDKVVELNLKGTFLCTRAAARIMKQARSGKIVNLSSITARAGGKFTPVQYVAAKGGIIALTRHVGQELAPFGINVNAVAPALVLSGARIQKMWDERKTDEQRAQFIAGIPMGRLPEVGEIVGAVLYLCSAEAGFVVGVTLDVNGGVFSA
ncbi:MAG: SDR family oxidoreductase [Desulfarculaceae bacterium]|nr:SDR family oxidoreductase [Desulfarculaceae bacterium]